MASDVVRVRLHLRQVRVLAVAVDTPSELVVEVGSAVRRPGCPACGFCCARVHDIRRREIRDLEVSGRHTTLVWMRRRFSWGNCGERFLEDRPAFERRLARRLVADAEVMTISAAARRHGLGWHLVVALVESWSDLVAGHRRSRRWRVLLVDEASMRRRHRYVSVIVNGDTGRALAMVEHRSAAALSGFFIAQRRRWCRGVQVVATDGSGACRSAIDARLGHARHVLERFHVIRWFSAGLTQARRDIQRRRPPGAKPVFEPEVFRARFALLRRADTLTDADRARLEGLFDARPRLRSGWQALQELHGPYLAGDHHSALETLGRFRDPYETAELPELHDIVDTSIARSDEILAQHHTDRASNGRIEGTNNPLQVLRRTAHGFTNPTNFEARGLLTTRPAHRCQQPLIPRLREGPCNPSALSSYQQHYILGIRGSANVSDRYAARRQRVDYPLWSVS